MTFFSADGVRALLYTRHIVTAAGGQLVLRRLSESVRRVFDILGDDRYFDIEDRA